MPSRRLEFSKLHGAGNDYVLVSALAEPELARHGQAWAPALAERHFGIGSDGLIIVGPSDRADVRMHMWNADGSRGAMCGNGLRCVAKLAYDSGIVTSRGFAIESDVGIHRVEVDLSGGEVSQARIDIGVVEVADDDLELSVAGISWQPVVRCSAGNPHAVVLLDRDPALVDVAAAGAEFQRHELFAQGGVNVEFVRIEPPDRMVQRTFERGSGETLACGSGATAVAATALARGWLPGPSVRVSLRGGEVIVTQKQGGRFELAGPVARSFDGTAMVEVD